MADLARLEGYDAILSPSAALAGAQNLNLYIDGRADHLLFTAVKTATMDSARRDLLVITVQYEPHDAMRVLAQAQSTTKDSAVVASPTMRADARALLSGCWHQLL